MAQARMRLVVDRSRRSGWILMTSGIILIVVAAALGAAMAVRVDQATGWIEHTYQVREGVSRTVIGLQNAEIAVRDSLLEGHGAEGGAPAQTALVEDLAGLRRLVADNPAQLGRLDEIDALAAVWLHALDQAAAASANAAAFKAALAKGDAAVSARGLRDRLAAFDAAEVDLLAERRSTAARLQAVLFGLLVASLLGAAVATIAVVTTSRSFMRQLQAQSAALIAESDTRRKAESLLFQAQKLELVGQLAAGVAHDFNNLLTIVIGNLDTVRRRIEKGQGLEPGRLAAPVETALEGAKRAAALTQKLLSFARQQPLAPRRLDLNRSVAALSDVLARTVGETVTIETVLAAGLWPAFADPAQVENAVINLVVNARDAMPGGGRITLETANAALDDHYAAQFADLTPGQYVMLSVSDTGIGVPKELLPRVFEPFFTTKEVGKGTGLGLAMIHGFVKQSRGHVRIYSEPGQGTTVKIYLPRMTGADPIATAPAEAPPDGRTPSAKEGEVVLLVEDDDAVRAFARGALGELGYAVLEARDGKEALAQLAGAGRIDALFTDVVLPGALNGRKLADEAGSLRPNLPVLYTTGYTRNAIVHDGRLDPGVRLISKPYTRDDIGRALRGVLDAAVRAPDPHGVQ